MKLITPFVRFDKAVLGFYDWLVNTGYEFDISRIMILRVFLVLWVATSFMIMWFFDHGFNIITSFMFGLVVASFVRVEYRNKYGDREKLNAIIHWQREKFRVFRFVVYLFFLSFPFFGEGFAKFPLTSWISNFCWLSYMIIDDTFYPTGPKKRKKKLKKTKQVYTGPWAPVK